MKRLSALFLSAAMTVAFAQLGTDKADAAQSRGNWTAQKRVNFKPQRAQQGVRKVYPGRQFNFFGLFGNRRFREPVEKKPVRRARPAVALPEEKPKIYTYPAPRTVALADSGLTGAAPDDTLAALILDSLRLGVARIHVTPERRKAILKFYAQRQFRPVWTSLAGIEERAFPVLERLARASEEGMEPALYRVPVVWSVNGDLAEIESSAVRLAQFDIELTAAALRYAQHASGGVVNPNKLSAYHDLRPPRVGAEAALEKLATSGQPAHWLAALQPSHRAYRIFRAALKRLGAGQREVPLEPIAAGPVIRPGGFDERLPLIRRHLVRLGLLHAGEKSKEAALRKPDGNGEVANDAISENDPNIYDAKLERAIRAFQKSAGLRADGLIGRGTLRALNGRRGGGAGSRARKIALNMERLRWEPRDFGRLHFFVNQPAFEAYLVRDGKTVWKTRVIIGKPKNQTAFFNDVMETVVFNPYWGVPQSILTREMMPRLMRDPSYLDRKGFEVYDRRGRRVSSASVDWYAYGGQSKVPFTVRQQPGTRNALGHIKFLFPNKHSIYMHDTPSRGLFSRKRRAFSHGCVRVQKPREMAELVTGLSRQTIEAKIAAGKNDRMRLKRKIPVHMAYFTAWPDDAGRIHYYADVYGRDRLLDTALKKTIRALSVRPLNKIARN